MTTHLLTQGAPHDEGVITKQGLQGTQEFHFGGYPCGSLLQELPDLFHQFMYLGKQPGNSLQIVKVVRAAVLLACLRYKGP